MPSQPHRLYQGQGEEELVGALPSQPQRLYQVQGEEELVGALPSQPQRLYQGQGEEELVGALPSQPQRLYQGQGEEDAQNAVSQAGVADTMQPSQPEPKSEKDPVIKQTKVSVLEVRSVRELLACANWPFKERISDSADETSYAGSEVCSGVRTGDRSEEVVTRSRVAGTGCH